MYVCMFCNDKNESLEDILGIQEETSGCISSGRQKAVIVDTKQHSEICQGASSEEEIIGMPYWSATYRYGRSILLYTHSVFKVAT